VKYAVKDKQGSFVKNAADKSVKFASNKENGSVPNAPKI